MEYYASGRKNELLPFVAAWMDLEIILLGEIAYAKPGSGRPISYDLTYKWNLINKTNK